MEVERVEKLRTKLQQEYPILSKIKKNTTETMEFATSNKIQLNILNFVFIFIRN